MWARIEREPGGALEQLTRAPVRGALAGGRRCRIQGREPQTTINANSFLPSGKGEGHKILLAILCP